MYIHWGIENRKLNKRALHWKSIPVTVADVGEKKELIVL